MRNVFYCSGILHPLDVYRSTIQIEECYELNGPSSWGVTATVEEQVHELKF